MSLAWQADSLPLSHQGSPIVSAIMTFTVKMRGREKKEGQKTETQEVLLKADQIKHRNLQISITAIKLEYRNHCRKVTSGLACPACEHLPLGISASGRNNWANIMSSRSSHSKLSISTSSYAMFPLSSSCFKDAAVLNGEIKALTILKGNTDQFSSTLWVSLSYAIV